MKNFLVLVLTLGCSFAAQAGDDWYEKGNGGFLLSCPGKAQRIFDFYEGETRHLFQMNVTENQKLDTRMNWVLDRLHKVNPTRAALYKGWYESFFLESQFLENTKLNPLGDIGFGYIPKECQLEQVIFQRSPSILNRSRYMINRDLWDTLDVVQKSLLITHELIYRELTAPGYGHQTSESVRYFNALIHSENLAQISTKDYLLALQELRFLQADYQGFVILLGTKTSAGGWKAFNIEFYDSNSVSHAVLQSEQNFRKGAFQFANRCPELDIEGYNNYVGFYPNGDLQYISLDPMRFRTCTLPSWNNLSAHQWTFGLGFELTQAQ